MTDARLLLADDNQELLDTLVELLDRSPGMVVVAAVLDGESALDQARELKPDIAVVDVRMPDGGPDLVRRLISADPGLRVIGLSSVRSGAVLGAMIAAGASDYLVKGDPDLDLVSVIHDLIDEVRPQEESG